MKEIAKSSMQVLVQKYKQAISDCKDLKNDLYIYLIVDSKTEWVDIYHYLQRTEMNSIMFTPCNSWENVRSAIESIVDEFSPEVVESIKSLYRDTTKCLKNYDSLLKNALSHTIDLDDDICELIFSHCGSLKEISALTKADFVSLGIDEDTSERIATMFEPSQLQKRFKVEE